MHYDLQIIVLKFASYRHIYCQNFQLGYSSKVPRLGSVLSQKISPRTHLYFLHSALQISNLLKSPVSEIRVKQIHVNQVVGVIKQTIFSILAQCEAAPSVRAQRENESITLTRLTQEVVL